MSPTLALLLSPLLASAALAAEPTAAPGLAQPIPLWGASSGAAPREDLSLPWGLRLRLSAAADGHAEVAGKTQLDAAGTFSSSNVQVSPLLRVGLRLSSPEGSGGLSARVDYEHDLPTGTVTGALPAGPGMPGGAGLSTQLRKASLQLRLGSAVTVAGGVMTSHFGLGLVANDGAHGWEPGSARFVDPRGGDRVLRGLVATGPHTALGLVAALAVDRVLDDDVLLLQREQAGGPAQGDDTARQLVGTVSLGDPSATWAGVFFARRNQTAADGRTLLATAASLSALGRWQLGPAVLLTGGVEGALISGETTLTATPTEPLHQVRQAALALRGGLDLGRFGFALDALAASGDPNLDDERQTAFHADPNYQLGILLFRQVLAAQSARSSFTAGDPALVGAPVAGVERLPTRGAATNTVAFFPRAFVRPVQGVEVYGGPLVAWAAVPPVDPFNTRLSGGSLRNALGGDPGKYLGTELDLGVRARFLAWAAELDTGLEGGVLLPGGALRRADGTPLPAVPGARAFVGIRY